MAVLTAKARKKIASKKFGLSIERKYPIQDKAHAVNAKARAKQQLNSGNLSRSEYSRIVAKANIIIKSKKKR